MVQNAYLGAHWCDRRQRVGFLSSSFSFVNGSSRRRRDPVSISLNPNTNTIAAEASQKPAALAV
jgi:hypothetical protein